MINLVLSIFASIGLLFGIVSMATPIPGGTVIIAASITLLICTSPRAQGCLKFFRARAKWLNSAFYWLENKVGDRISIVGNALKRTHPEDNV